MKLLQVKEDIRFKTNSLVELLMTDEERDAQKVNKVCSLNNLHSQHSGFIMYMGSSANCQKCLALFPLVKPT